MTEIKTLICCVSLLLIIKSKEKSSKIHSCAFDLLMFLFCFPSKVSYKRVIYCDAMTSVKGCSL